MAKQSNVKKSIVFDCGWFDIFVAAISLPVVSFLIDIMAPDMASLRRKRWGKAFDPSLSNEAFLSDYNANCKATIARPA